MVTMNISVPDTIKAFVDHRIAEGGFDTASDYFIELVRLDQQRKEQAKLEAVLVERVNGSDWEEFSTADSEYLRSELKARLAQEG
jgi:antitoxin ParD1/3/4